MKKIEVGLLTLLFVVVAVGIYFARTNPEYFKEVYVREDGFVETGTAIGLFGASVISFYRFIRLRNLKPKRFLFGCFFLGLVFLFGAGEEISWGQRIFGMDTPEVFLRHNVQAETNLHNLVVGGVKINKLIFGTVLGVGIVFYLAILPLLCKKMPALQSWVDGWAIPIPRWQQIVAYLVLAALVSLIPSSKKGELLEFGGCILFFLILLYPVNEQIFSAQKRQP